MRARRHQTLQERIDERRPDLERLIGDLSRFVRRFDANRPFVGPSLYFHAKTIQALRRHSTPVEALHDDLFFDYLYATLTSWGLHRLGSGNTRLGDLDDLKASFRDQTTTIKQLQHRRIERLSSEEVREVTEKAWNIMANLQVGIGETLLVANSKALHHLLPDLIPPIDRTYTLMFFVGRPYIYRNRDAAYFRALYPLFHQIAVRCSGEIHRFIAEPSERMNTSVTKVIDNAILGFMSSISDLS
ncbi:MAG TPA: hypothetical protein VFA45_18895 [Actinomycetes bacterium]|nr:hypothetical protein [Actinomycetes bacterium]